MCALFFPTQGKVYVYDKVFKPNATQEKVYNEAAKVIVKGMWRRVFFAAPPLALPASLLLFSSPLFSDPPFLLFCSFVLTACLTLAVKALVAKWRAGRRQFLL